MAGQTLGVYSIYLEGDKGSYKRETGSAFFVDINTRYLRSILAGMFMKQRVMGVISRCDF